MVVPMDERQAVALVVGLVVHWASLTVDGMVDNSAVGKVVLLDEQQVGSLAVESVDSKDVCWAVPTVDVMDVPWVVEKDASMVVYSVEQLAGE